MNVPNGWWIAVGVLLLDVAIAAAQQQDSAVGDTEPFLRINGGGPQSYVTALAFGPGGDTLYAAGWDKVVHVWRRDPETGRYDIEPDAAYRLPVGPGLRGAINAMAISEDGQWLAVAGHGIIRGGSTFRRPGRVLPSEGILTPDMRLDEGVIYVFHTRTREVHLLRGHAGAVLALTFAPGSFETPVLVSAAVEWREDGTGPAGSTGTVRAWDVSRRQRANAYLGGRYLPEPTSRPGLAVRRLGAELSAVQVAIAWGDQRFRLWDVATGRMRDTPCGQYGNTVSAAGDGFVTGVFDGGGQVEHRRPLDTGSEVSLGGSPGTFFIPRALAVEETPGALSRVAVVTRLLRRGPDPIDQFVLQLADIPATAASITGQAPLWGVPSTGAVPAVAVSASRELVAVAGNADQSIWLYRFADIREGGAPSEVLRNGGSSWESVTMVMREAARGLRLTGPDGELVFDLAGQEGQVGPTGSTSWRAAEAIAEGWRLASQEQSPVALVQFDGQDVSRVTLPDQEVVSTYAFAQVPDPGNGNGRMIVAIASHQRGQATLRLANARSGEVFRQLTGHTETIRGLSFSADGRLLASVAGDQMICLWDLSDVDEILGKHGMLVGVSLQRGTGDGQTGAVVNSVLPTAPPDVRRGLAPGDVLEALVVGGQDVRLSGGRGFFDAFWKLQPGTAADLRIRRGAARSRLSLRVGQAVDERKPLLNVYLTRADDERGREWIAWTPLGPYEASGRGAERFLGWHFNTGDPAQPTRFAAAQQYREFYHRDGLVRELIGQGRLERRPPPPPVAITIGFDRGSLPARGEGGTLLLRRVPRELRIYLGDFPAELVEGIEVTAGPRTIKDQLRPEGDEWVIELGDLQWQRGSRRFRTLVRTAELPPREFLQEAAVQLVPLPPTVRSPLSVQQVVEEPQFRLVAEAEAESGRPVQWRLRHNEHAPVTGTGGQIDQPLMLDPGDNVIVLTAINGDAPADGAGAETSQAVFRVTYQRARSLPPAIAMDRFESVDAVGAAREVWPGSEPPVVVVEHPRLRVQGTIRSESPLESTSYRLGPQGERRPLRVTQDPGDNASWSFSETIQLEPGRQELGVLARATDSDEAHAQIDVEFAPPLPEIVFDSEQSAVVFRDAREPPAEIELAGRFLLPDPSYPFAAQVMQNDEGIGEPEFSADRASWTATVPLKRGENRIRLLLTNRWGRQATSETRLVEYRRLPQVVQAIAEPVDRQPFADVTARIESPRDVPLTGVSVGGRHLDSTAWQPATEVGDTAVWEVVGRIPLEPGENVFRVIAMNADGPCREPASVSLVYDARLWAPPEVTFLNAAPSGSVADAEYRLAFRVDSPTPLHAVQIEVDGHRLPEERVSISETVPDGESDVWEVAADLVLRRGVNRVAVRVTNEGGEAHQQRELNFVPAPLLVRVTSLEPEGQPEAAIRAVGGGTQRLVFEQPVATGYARLRGAVEWRTGAAPEAPPQLRIWVNGFQQRPITLEAAPGRQPFEALLVLGEATGNQILLDVVGAASEARSQLEFTVDCLEPLRARRLHLVMIGVEEKDPLSLRRRALTAVRATEDDAGSFRQPLRAQGFDRINVYPPLTGHVTFSDVFRLLLDVRAALQVPAGLDAAGRPIPLNDVVMLYYEGGIVVPERDAFLLSTSERYDPQNRFSAVSSDWLGRFFDSMQGAPLALIDVLTGQPAEDFPLDSWNHDSHAALLCYTWSPQVARPAERRLIGAVQQALNDARRLGEVDRFLQQRSAESPDLEYLSVLPERLKALPLAQP